MMRLVTLALLTSLACPAPGLAGQRVMIAAWRGCEEACEGFKKGLGELGVDAQIILRDADRKAERLPEILAEAREIGVDLILSWGTTVSVGIAGTLEQLDEPGFNHDIPQVFMIVADPVGAGLVDSLDQTRRPNLTGTYNRVPESVNIDMIRAYRPDFRRLGLLFHTSEPNSVLKRDELAELSVKADFELIAHALPIGSDGKPDPEDIEASVEALAAKKVDFLYIGSSSFLRSNAKLLTEAAMSHQLPVLSPYEELVREGDALLSVAARYYDVGRLAAEQAARILLDGVQPGDLPVARVREFAIVINLDVARRLGRFPPIALLQVAETVK